MTPRLMLLLLRRTGRHMTHHAHRRLAMAIRGVFTNAGRRAADVSRLQYVLTGAPNGRLERADSAADADDMQSDAASWFRFVCFFVATLAGSLAAVAALIAVIDPFDRGHRLSLIPPGVLDESPRTANVSRGRDPRFNAAIIGNSHVQLMDPDRLSGITGFRFTQLSTPSTGPREQTALLKWFMRNHANIRALVIGIDGSWCRQDENPPMSHPFPFWLYGDDLHYVAHLLSTRSLDLGWRRVLIAMGRSTATDPAGYWNYETGRTWNYHPALLERMRVDLSPVAAPDLKFPSIEAVEPILALLPADVRVVLVMPPVFYTGLPEPGTAGMRQMAGCKYDIVRRAARHRWLFADFYSDTPLSRDPANFWDASHVRMAAAQFMEERIAQELSHLGQAESQRNARLESHRRAAGGHMFPFHQKSLQSAGDR